MRELWVWMNGERVGVWTRGRTGHHRFTYEASWLASPRARSLSLSVPISSSRTIEGAVVGNFFDNLLPDDERIRRRLSVRFKTNSTEAFELLRAIGRDCVGAIQLLPPEREPVGFDRLEYEALSDADVERILQGVPVVSGPGMREEEEGLRISIAGAQEKTALLRVGQQWCRPRGATPTTHILKLPLGRAGGRKLDLTHSVENEWLCAQILDALGLPVARTEIATFGGQKALAVERFDRRWMDARSWIARLPQEDFCQVLGVPGQAKYEVDGGPGMTKCLSVLAGSEEAGTDGQTFLRAQLAFWLMAATDGHAKNFSIFVLEGDRYCLTPLYDVLSAWPVIGEGPNHMAWQKAKLAMAVRAKNVHYKLSEIQTRHWHQLAHKSGFEGAWDAMLQMVQRVDTALGAVEERLPATYPAPTAQAIFEGVRAQVKAFREGLTAL
ncbi:MAG: type II toxin-antitoxin system HipA family toxin [Rhodocyclales bacterium]|nr:type II toxin-antitoxin system HipA family toxin [Rhodocyclales bacterium]